MLNTGHSSRPRYTAAERRAAEAARLERLARRDREAAGLTLEVYLAREAEVQHVDADTTPILTARHAALVAQYGTPA